MRHKIKCQDYASGLLRCFATYACSFAGIVLISATATAQTEHRESGTQQIFEATYFDDFAPNTAFEMIERLPGFTFLPGQTRRGLGQGGANVLLNSERFTGKGDVIEQLNRIPARNVIRIEIVEGASLDIPGLSGPIANVLTRSTGRSGTWSWSPSWQTNSKPNLTGASLSVTGDIGDVSYSASLENNGLRRTQIGPELLFDNSGLVFERRTESISVSTDQPKAALGLTWKPKEHHIGHLNLTYGQLIYDEVETSLRSAVLPRGQTLRTRFEASEDEWNASASGDYAFPLGPGSLKIIGYHRFERSPVTSQFDEFDGSDRIAASIFDQNSDESETIARAEYSWKQRNGYDWQVNVEGALNSLDIESNLKTLNAVGEFDSVILPNASSRVEEKRAEIAITHGRKVFTGLDLQLSLAAEYSELTQTGGLSRQFVRPKGFISAAYNPDSSTTWSARLEREVGQLRFFDFIASVNLADDLTNAANINLVPSQNWIGEVAFEKRFSDNNVFKATLYGTQFSDLVDRIPIGLEGDAVGNISRAGRYGLLLNSTLTGDRWGLPGAELKAELNMRESSVDDPVEQFDRRLNGDLRTFWGLWYRHDIPKTKWAYGASIDQSVNARSYRIDSYSQYEFSQPFASAFIEHKDVFGMKAVITYDNILGGEDQFSRVIYSDRRDIGAIDFTEARRRPWGKRLRLELSGTF